MEREELIKELKKWCEENVCHQDGMDNDSGVYEDMDYIDYNELMAKIEELALSTTSRIVEISDEEVLANFPILEDSEAEDEDEYIKEQEEIEYRQIYNYAARNAIAWYKKRLKEMNK